MYWAIPFTCYLTLCVSGHQTPLGVFSMTTSVLYPSSTLSVVTVPSNLLLVPYLLQTSILLITSLLLIVSTLSIAGLVASSTWSSLVLVLSVGWVRLYCFPLTVLVVVCYVYVNLQYISISSGLVLTLLYYGILHLVWMMCWICGSKLVMVFAIICVNFTCFIH